MTSRNVQIAEMIKAFPSITVIVPDELYSLPFTKPDCSLLIDLPPEFPAVEPILLVEPVVEHKWILPSGQVKAPTVTGRTLVALLKEFQLELAENKQGYSPSTNYSSDSFLSRPMDSSIMGNISTVNTMSNTVQQQTFSTNYQHQPISINQPHIPTSPVHRQLMEDDRFLVDQLDGEQIQTLLADEQAFEAFLSTLDTFRALDADVIQAENFKIAEQNLRHKAGMDALAKELQEVQEKYSVALQHYQLTLQVNSEALQKLDLNAIKEHLRAELKEADRSSQMFLKEALTSGSIESQIKDYIRQRKIFHYKSILLQKFET